MIVHSAMGTGDCIVPDDANANFYYVSHNNRINCLFSIITIYRLKKQGAVGVLCKNVWKNFCIAKG